ncbi:MAG: TetR family transcriptional regulator C-terminal domain-containing protein, partial [Pseudomonadota bacterium]
WIDTGRMQRTDPVHLIFTIWATTQHYADFSIQVKALTGRDLSDPDFFEETVASVTGLLLNGIGLTVPQDGGA